MISAAQVSPSALPFDLPARLLCECLGFDAPAQQTQSPLNRSAEEWDVILAEARRLGALNLLAYRIRGLQPPPAHLDPAVREDLQRGLINSIGRNLKLYHRLQAILTAMQAREIPVILLKGAHLAKYVYPDIGMRPMSDLDILVPSDRLPQADAALQGLGYLPTRLFDISSAARSHHHLPPYTADGLLIELHWNLAPATSSWQIDLDGLWRRAQPLPPASPSAAAALGLSTEDLLLHLSLHILKDEFVVAFRRIYDIAQVIEHFQGQMDWPALFSRAAEWRLEKGLFLTLYLAQTLFNATIDREMLWAHQPRDFSAEIAEMAIRRTLTPPASDPALHPLITRLARRQPLSTKLRRAWMAMFPYPEYIAAKYGLPKDSKKVVLYYPWRLLQIAAASGAQLLRLATKDPGAADAAYVENLLNDWWMSPIK